MYLTCDSSGWCLWNNKPMMDEEGIYVVDGLCISPDMCYPLIGLLPKPQGFKVPKGGYGMWKVKLSNSGMVKV